MIKFFTPEPLPGFGIVPQFFFKFAPARTMDGLFTDNRTYSFFAKQEYVQAPEQADAIVLPNNFTSLDDKAHTYIAQYVDLAERFGKPLYLFSFGDYTDTLHFDPRANVFRHSLYGATRMPTDISVPTLTQDLGAAGIVLRHKEEKPTVSFVGKAGFGTPRETVASHVKYSYYTALGIFKPLERARIRGVFWRRWMMKACAGSEYITTRFISRKTFSGAARTIEVPPEVARKDFLDSIVESDFVLAPKGDGNYSNRFLEGLSLGRIPVFVDTDMVLSSSEKIEYEKITVRVPMSDVKNTPDYIRKFYDALSEEEWQARQRFARDTYAKYLFQDAFWEQFFAGLSA